MQRPANSHRRLNGFTIFLFVMAVLAVMMIFTDHWAHAFGFLPYLILLACPFMHVFMHGRHRHHSGGHEADTAAGG